LFEVICSRYFDLGNEGPYPPSWEVRGADGEDVSRQLLSLNKHLSSMGMVGSLEESNPPILAISKLPPGRDVMHGWQQGLLWAVMATFLTSVGSHWVAHYGHGSNPAGTGEFGQSVLYFTLPVILTLLVASQARAAVARRFDVDIGHMIPIVFPIPAWWPFGLVGVLGQRRPDLVPMPSRRALGSIEIAAPLVISVSGFLLTIAGLMMTSSSPPELDGPPVVFEAGLLASSLADSWMGGEMEIRLQWLHPTGIAGIALSLVGWGLMLPIPGLPGDRVLQSVIGPSEMRKGGAQTSIFVAVLVVMVLVFATAEWSPWIFLAFFAAWQRFSPDNVPQPVVLNEYEELDERFRSRFVSLSMIILLAGMPGAVPSYELEDYDSGLTTLGWAEEVSVSPGEESIIELDIAPSGVLPVYGWLQMRVEGPQSDEWEIQSSCSEDVGACRISGVTQIKPGMVTIRVTPPAGDIVPHLLRILVDVSGFEEEHLISLSNSTHNGPTGPFWEIVERGDRPVICTSLRAGDDGGNLTIEGSYWSPMNKSSLSSGVSLVCLEGHEGAILGSGEFDAQGRALGPGLVLHSNNSSSGPWVLAIEGSGKSVQSENGSWEVPTGFASAGDVIFHADSGAPFCPSSEVVAQVDTVEDWSADLGNYSSLRILGGLSGNGTIGIGSTGWLAVCHEDGSMDSYRILQSVDVYVSPGGIGVGISEEEFTIYNRAANRMSLSVEWHGDSPQSSIWEVEIPDGVGTGESVRVRATPVGESPLERSVWVTADSSVITVHLSARCPQGGC
tara:strand:+ start:1667 stop:4018 length:2352 start_codon:yes stop_codon:yes gene_type:complete